MAYDSSFAMASELRYLGKAGHEADLANCSQDWCLRCGLCSAYVCTWYLAFSSSVQDADHSKFVCGNPKCFQKLNLHVLDTY